MAAEEKVREIMARCGAPLCGFLKFERVEPHLLECRAKAKIDFEAKAVIMAVFPYKIDKDVPSNLARYARLKDYHKVVGGILERACGELSDEFEGKRFVWFVDNSPIPEVSAAAFCGLGVVGENGLLIHEKYGSFVFIGEIVTDLELIETGAGIGRCDECGACADACPARCIGGDKRGKCISFLTQKKGELAEGETELIRQGGYAFGCDICQEVCPCNRDVPLTYIEEFLESGIFVLDEENLESSRDRAFSWRGPEVARRNLGIISADFGNNKGEK